ncbi:hypothetical protein [Thermococcus gammatolerans]|uniref:Uncharacterized protein n=1 Tax=Thermococcus gammatolerans (strain DSM 15229 / JCM 11827 / EJ3) TaxID=593117 RepID=C5A3I9_THEGJ|nr:hypothetical protein [Thermococcus gammatolerans]ACS32801.1 Hypothetical protein TGAM_0299 [Thermococcus gammatolerans EJ3]
MRFIRSFLSGFFLILLSSLIMVRVRGLESGLYVFAINVMFIPMWGTMVLWSRGTGKNLLIKLITLTSLLSSVGALGVIALVYNDFEKATGVIVSFLAWYLLFIAPMYCAKKSRERSGEQLSYPPTDAKYFWVFQWIDTGILAVKSDEPLKVFLYLLPGLIGGYLIILGLIEAKRAGDSMGDS